MILSIDPIYFPTGHPGKSHASYESVVSLKCIFPNKKQKNNQLASSSFTFLWKHAQLKSARTTTVKFTQAKRVQVLGFTWFHRQIRSRWHCFFSVELDYNFIPWICGSNVHQTTTNVTYLKDKNRCVFSKLIISIGSIDSAHISWVESEHKPSETPSTKPGQLQRCVWHTWCSPYLAVPEMGGSRTKKRVKVEHPLKKQGVQTLGEFTWDIIREIMLKKKVGRSQYVAQMESLHHTGTTFLAGLEGTPPRGQLASTEVSSVHRVGFNHVPWQIWWFCTTWW